MSHVHVLSSYHVSNTFKAIFSNCQTFKDLMNGGFNFACWSFTASPTLEINFCQQTAQQSSYREFKIDLFNFAA